MNVIFLDHQWTMFLREKENLGKLDYFDLEAVNILNEILYVTNCDIVVSSDWKLWVNLEEMQKFYIEQGIKPPIAYTSFLLKDNYAKSRTEEIIKWVSDNDVNKWVVVDDLDMREYFTSNFVWIEDKNFGIKGKNIKEEIIKYLC
jgi:hypothetical protein